MEKTEAKHRFGLLGKNISYSFSKGYFAAKFKALNLAHYSYDNFDLQDISQLADVLQNTENLKGLNVTIPYKEQVLEYISELDDAAEEIGAVNTIKISPKGLKGYNTDAYGFKNAIAPYLQAHHNKALILGTGGASKAIAYVLKKQDIAFAFVSRTGKNSGYTYDELDGEIISNHQLIINCSPVGTFPNVDKKPQIPYQFISKNHLLFDLIYNPEQTAFLKKGASLGATTLNGYTMLELQAEKAWQIWNAS